MEGAVGTVCPACPPEHTQGEQEQRPLPSAPSLLTLWVMSCRSFLPVPIEPSPHPFFSPDVVARTVVRSCVCVFLWLHVCRSDAVSS